ncbi:hypothetical protein [Cryobacterium zhongshanensis]|uniref:Uncharacterized protein n=1 Tax=Cryobacterium zhongshanensis TaxID=2928153 RepID=A0AA41QWV6_9MICO|nr:hypothetical protein [Cryobacterium zhongshanensis]MCI4659650.1 hypothetical protein [Cryobacterium zhongshanensis]
MRLRKSRRTTQPQPRLLPLDAYPDTIDEEGRDRIDRRLRLQLASVPIEPGPYLDPENEPWTLNTDGSWTDKNGTTRSKLYAPMLSMYAPFTRVSPEPEQAPANG